MAKSEKDLLEIEVELKRQEHTLKNIAQEIEDEKKSLAKQKKEFDQYMESERENLQQTIHVETMNGIPVQTQNKSVFKAYAKPANSS